MMIKRFLLCLFLISLVFSLIGCGVRSRVLVVYQDENAQGSDAGDASHTAQTDPREPGDDDEDGEWPSDNPAETVTERADQDAPTQSDPKAERREYASDASAELSPDAGVALLVETDSPKTLTAPDGSDAPPTTARQAGTASLTVTETVTREEAKRLGVSEEAPKAETAMQYYQAMLESRLSSLFECEKLYVYWETPLDYQTVYKASVEHSLILLAGGYDVSAKRLEDALMVDDGWVGRKNPGCVVKSVDAHVLGDGVHSTTQASAACIALIQRPGWNAINAVKNQTILLLSAGLLDTRHGQLAAALYIAKAMYPTLFADLDANEAHRLLSREATGTEADGIYAYAQRGEL